MTRKQTLVLKLRRQHNRPWGFRIAGGSDLETPIIVTHSENEELQKGDVIKKIDEYDCRDVRHVDAQNLLQNSQSVKLVVERSEPAIDHSSPNNIVHNLINRKSIANTKTSEATFISLRKLSQAKFLPKSPVPSLISTSKEYKAFSPDHFDPPREHLEEVREERFYLSQPYRTTPLVLPGAKIKKDAPLAECYLRHHPNPMIRAPPHHYDIANPEAAIKQKVAESVLQRVLGPNEVPKVVHKQFNSPIGLYSEQNIADTIKCQTSAVPPMKPVKYDPSKSEAYKALQEEDYGDEVQQVNQPARTGVFSPHRAHHNKMPQHPSSKSPASSFASGYDDEGEKIHQSNSFKRIMYSVLGQTDY